MVSTGSALYSNSFFSGHQAGSELSAARIIPEVLKIISPASVIDVGCGLGTWAAEFQRHGISDVLGVDGEYVNRTSLKIAPEFFLARDLDQPLIIERRFDLAVCLEVAEHLPIRRSDGLVADLIALADFVLFSAAIPGQGGTFHVNEQWPDFWANKFQKHDYVALDCIRQIIWNDDKIAWWYRQNIILFAHVKCVKNNAVLQHILERQPPALIRLVHPALYEILNERLTYPGPRDLLRSLPKAIMRALGNRFQARAQRSL